jgi:hypothetical protein
MHFKSVVYNSFTMFPKKPYTLAGFEPGSSFPEADVYCATPPGPIDMGNFLWNDISSPILSFKGKVKPLFWQNMGWATLWAIFYIKHLATLKTTMYKDTSLLSIVRTFLLGHSSLFEKLKIL